MKHESLKLRIKKNEGFSLKPYKDQLGNHTIGYGHLIKKNEKKFFKIKFSKIFFDNLFEKDFSKALEDYKHKFKQQHFSKAAEELIIEMIFQLGIKNVNKFKKMKKKLSDKQKYLVCLEMMDSLWYKQTPKRVENLIKNYLGAK